MGCLFAALAQLDVNAATVAKLVADELAKGQGFPSGSLTGWTSAGLLGTILGWLLVFYIPRQETRSDKKDADFREYLEELEKKYLERAEQRSRFFQEEMRSRDQAYNESSKEMRQHYLADLHALKEHCRQEVATMAATFQDTIDRLLAKIEGRPHEPRRGGR